jgi:hypothetical protein
MESKINIMFTPRDSENLALVEQVFKDENEAGFNEEIVAIKRRFGDIIFDDIINSNCINCYRGAAKDK